ncbi:MAG: hypothetical protein QW194_04210 [Candidatus Micrarchaeaceae archaeon]
MPQSVHTPVLDAELLALRRVLGDTYDSAGNLITTDTSHNGGGNIYIGHAQLVSTWTSGELIDIYNSACVRFVEYMVNVIEKNLWHRFIPGLIKYADNVPIDSLSRIPFSNISPRPLVFMDVAVTLPNSFTRVGVEISPSEFFAHSTGDVKTRASQLLYTIMSDSTDKYVRFLHSAPATQASLVYVCEIPRFIHDVANPGDITKYFSNFATMRIRIIAEKLAQRYRMQEAPGLADADDITVRQYDVQVNKGH